MTLVAVEVKSSDPRDSANDQKSQPRADLLCQIPRLCPASPLSGLTLIGTLNETSSLAFKNNLVYTIKAVRCLSALSRKLLNGLLANLHPFSNVEANWGHYFLLMSCTIERTPFKGERGREISVVPDPRAACHVRGQYSWLKCQRVAYKTVRWVSRGTEAG